MTPMQKALAVAEKARQNLNETHPMAGSAKLCYEDAVSLLAKGEPTKARARALTSLRYSVGILSAIYQEAESL